MRRKLSISVLSSVLPVSLSGYFDGFQTDSSTINSYLSVNNAYLDFIGHREYQLANQLKLETELQPELTRTEYLRLLQTARALDREKVYLLVKLFGSTGLTVQELEKVTVEAVKEGKLTVSPSRNKQVLRISEGLQKELMGYARRNGYLLPASPWTILCCFALITTTIFTWSMRNPMC